MQDSVHTVLKRVLGLHPHRLRFVLGLPLRCLPNHALHVILGQTSTGIDHRELLRLAARRLNSFHVQDAVRVNVKRDLNLRLPTLHPRNAVQHEACKKGVVACQVALALQYTNHDALLVVSKRRERLRLLRWESRVALHYGAHHTVCGRCVQ
mmetsp:Transcript_29585/g.96695  ORF Transcript_29585/g.96695 Transcript_29585/m.96695 type:complete len:152 (+) Transcript_29585:22-477(+)